MPIEILSQASTIDKKCMLYVSMMAIIKLSEDCVVKLLLLLNLENELERMLCIAEIVAEMLSIWKTCLNS